MLVTLPLYQSLIISTFKKVLCQIVQTLHCLVDRSYLELDGYPDLHEAGVLPYSVRDPALHPVPHTLLRLRSNTQLQQPIVRAGDGLEEVGQGVRGDPVVLHVQGLQGAVLLQGGAKGRDSEVTDLRREIVRYSDNNRRLQRKSY